MKCTVCKNGETEKRPATLTLSKGESIFVYRNVPADVCGNCGEQYFDESTTQKLLEASQSSIATGTIINVKDYLAA